MAYNIRISGGEPHGVPSQALKNLEEHMEFRVDSRDFEVTKHSLVLTHRDNAARLLELTSEPNEHGLRDRFFALLNPETHDVLAVRPLLQQPGGLTLWHLRSTNRFEIRGGEVSKGYGSAATAAALEFALKSGKSLLIDAFENMRWAKFFKRIGFPIDLKNINQTILVSAEKLKEIATRKGRNSFKYYLPKEKPAVEGDVRA